MNQQPVSIFWFRRDLRLDDNHGLFQALQSQCPVLPVFIFDKNILGPLPDKADKRVLFIYQSLARLNEKLIKVGSSLFVVHDTPNNGNWQWAAGTDCDAAPYFRIFNPTRQTKRFDPKLLYIEKWIPDFDDCPIGTIVEHKFARKRTLAAYSGARRATN